mgnify:CR=1 FL=1
MFVVKTITVSFLFFDFIVYFIIIEYIYSININFNTGNNLMVNDTGISSYSPEFEFADGSRRFMAKGSVQWITTREATNTESTGA